MKKKKSNSTFSKINKFGIISLLFSVIGIIKYGIICGVIAVIIGIIGLITFKKETQKGKEFAILGISIGVTDIVMSIIWTIFYNI